MAAAACRWDWGDVLNNSAVLLVSVVSKLAHVCYKQLFNHPQWLQLGKSDTSLHLLQVVVQGIPWKYTGKELQPMFEECGTIDRAEVVYGRDGRSRVSFQYYVPVFCPISSELGLWHQGQCIACNHPIVNAMFST